MSLANRMAMASESVHALAVEATEFPSLARRHGVRGVPRTVVNREGAFEGALPESQFVLAVLQLAGVDLDGESGGTLDEPPADTTSGNVAGRSQGE